MKQSTPPSQAQRKLTPQLHNFTTSPLHHFTTPPLPCPPKLTERRWDHFIVALFLPLIFFTFPITVRAEKEPSPTMDECRNAVDQALAREQRLYRISLFGRQKAEDTPIGSVRFDNDGWAYYKMREGRWFSPGELQDSGRYQGNRGMDQVSEQDSVPVADGGMNLSPWSLPHRGIFDTKRVLTSEIVPHLTQALRAFACRIDMVCYRVAESAKMDRNSPDAPEYPDGKFPIRALGCIRTVWPPVEECMFTEKGGSTLNQVDALSYCKSVGLEMLHREGEVIRMLVEYDAAYRSLLQFAGVFDEFLLEMRWTMAGSIRQAASIIGWLGRIPCFISSCDEYPPDLDPNAPGTPYTPSPGDGYVPTPSPEEPPPHYTPE